MIKKLSLLLYVGVFMNCVYAQTDCDTLYINMGDFVAKYHVEDIDSITFATNLTPQNPHYAGGGELKNKAASSWIDDDFLVDKYPEIYEVLHSECISKDIRCDFAFIPRGTKARLTLAQKWEDEGFNFLMHPYHKGWYDSGDVKQDIIVVRSSFIECLREFQNNFASARKRVLVYPGNSNQYSENVDFIKQYVECAITATHVGSNHETTNDRYQLKRLSLKLSSNMTKTKLKELIKSYLDAGDWVILYSHIYDFEISDVVDETTNSIANLMEVVEYANSLAPIRSTESIWDERKILYNSLMFK